MRRTGGTRPPVSFWPSGGTRPPVSFWPYGGTRPPVSFWPYGGTRPPVSFWPYGGTRPPVSFWPYGGTRPPVSFWPYGGTRPPVSFWPYVFSVLEVFRGPYHRAPHMRDGAVVKAQALFLLTEVTADHIGEFIELDVHVRVEGIDVVQRNHAARHVRSEERRVG